MMPQKLIPLCCVAVMCSGCHICMDEVRQVIPLLSVLGMVCIWGRAMVQRYMKRGS